MVCLLLLTAFARLLSGLATGLVAAAAAYLLSVAVLAGLLAGLAAVLTAAARFLVDYGICRIDVNSGERKLLAEGGSTLLQALYAERIYVPSACGQKGSCGHCRIAVLSGGGPVLPTETPYLTARETASGLRLACQVKVREDLRVRIPAHLLDVRMFSATVERTRSVTHDTKEIRLALPGPQRLRHRPGQYVQVRVPSTNGPVFRAYSISSPAREMGVVELVVRLVPGGVGSTYLHGLSVGDSVAFTGPYGEFRLDEDPSVEVVCVGGGCGMAPIRNIIRSLYDTWPDRSCRLFFGCRTRRDALYIEEFDELARERPGFRLVYALSSPSGNGDGWEDGRARWAGGGPGETPGWRTFREEGLIHLSVDRHLEPNGRRQAFLCGPPPMIEAATCVLKGKGLRDEDIFCDAF